MAGQWIVGGSTSDIGPVHQTEVVRYNCDMLIAIRLMDNRKVNSLITWGFIRPYKNKEGIRLSLVGRRDAA